MFDTTLFFLWQTFLLSNWYMLLNDILVLVFYGFERHKLACQFKTEWYKNLIIKTIYIFSVQLKQ